jgi:hypothetical protein
MEQGRPFSLDELTGASRTGLDVLQVTLDAQHQD